MPLPSSWRYQAVLSGEPTSQWGLVAGAIACATAPAATIAIIRECKAGGPLSTTLLAVVALDDVIAIVAFAIAVGVAQPLVLAGASFSPQETMLVPLLHILESVAVGVAFGFASAYVARFTRTPALVLVVIIGTVASTAGVAELLGASSLLANMVVGFIVANRSGGDRVLLVLEGVEEVIFAVFFVLAGMHFDLSTMQTAGVLAAVLIACRCSGKYFGARVGARLAGAPAVVRKYLGLTLLPKAGVTIGLGLLVEAAFPSFGAIVFNALLASTIVDELIAPPLVKYAITKAGEHNSAS